MRQGGKRTLIGLAIGLTVSAAFVTACGDDDGGTVVTTPPSQATAIPTPAGGQTQNTVVAGSPIVGIQTPVAGAVGVATIAGKQVLTSPDGFTLYVTSNDVPDSGTSTCTASCAQVWPPFVVTEAPEGPTEATGTFGIITRRDGQQQATYNGRPLYRYQGDTGPGDANGDGIGGGIWTVATP
jgi:predicted lipoprotein with Yx(FWY)xxD motif